MIEAIHMAFSFDAFALGYVGTICGLLFLDGLKLGHVWKSELFLYGLIGSTACYLIFEGTWSNAQQSVILGIILGGISGVAWLRIGVLHLDKWVQRLSVKSLINAEKHSDIRTLDTDEKLPDFHYDPWEYFQKGKHFMGMDKNKKPYYLTKLPHGFYGGTTGSGKGNALQSHAAQSVMNDEALIYFDPKDDKFAPHALYAACQKYNRSYRYINLGSDQPAQLNIIAGANERELVQLLQAGFVLTDKNTDGDHHRDKDRKAARLVAAMIYQNKLTLAEAFERVCDDDFFVQKASGFLEKLEAVARHSVINAKSDEPVLSNFIRDGGAIYVQSAMDEEIERIAQRFILIRVNQIASARDRFSQVPRTVCVVADEVRFQMSRPLLNILSTGRDKGLRALMAFQSMVDLRASETDLKPDVIEGIVLENTQIKHIYCLEDPTTAKWLAEKSGQVLVRTESFDIRKNLLLVERLTKSAIREDPAYLLSPNVTLNLDVGWGVLLHKGRVKRLLIRSLPCVLKREAVTVVSCSSSSSYLISDTPHSFFSLDDSL